MAIESNDLNVIGDEIRKIETKIKELTSVGKQKGTDKDQADGSKRKNANDKNDGDAGDPYQKVENSRLFNNLSQYLSGQILDDVNSNAELLLQIQETKQVVESVLVKHLNFDPSHITDFSEIPAFTQTFRIYRTTKFVDLKQAACKFW